MAAVAGAVAARRDRAGPDQQHRAGRVIHHEAGRLAQALRPGRGALAGQHEQVRSAGGADHLVLGPAT